ncbi:lytic transglycosylase domain-containing protein [Microbacterium sp. zg.Y1090]|uniref:aggregation-promoting factor C-terminal-like domain-containing protein n=1 Tax=Microbacterium TaxID=33882 RepID=UPI00214C34A0|nr:MULTISPECIES: lytic transglycosylase domain-containing protein [unclassified Microbacterium]MCR2812709.1 lytic transglycosylase domain-containing protein [Microbacterium sp. zg.Y1084]MCR2817497.1 lytic transglycosylase domain-containing protein [Microbacterium sp. zg.Y1090]MDL5485861.1 lytic transglycosylase domain-containing protein [Microbacterium sp. zg-Y1211]WIM29020.1 lytic transglycosylase domain-containing protein [Microbacterium sp. zg-Y1090]
MLSDTTTNPTRRSTRHTERRLRRRPLLAVATLAVGIVAAACSTASTPAASLAWAAQPPVFELASSTTPLHAEAAAQVKTADDPASEADQALAAAQAAVAAATAVAADIAASGLDIGAPDTTVDTAGLSTAVQQLERAQALPFADLDETTDEVAAETGTVNEATAGLRGRLDAAVAAEAERVAAEQARLEAEAAAAAAAAEAEAAEAAARPSSSGGSSAPASPSPVYASGGAVGGTSPADAQATAHSMLAGYGWGDDQFGCLVSLWNKESGWNYQAYNAGSGAFGIPQALPGSKMASAGADWQTNPATQIAWGLGYISGRYGSPCGAWGHSQSVGWY